MRVLKLFVLGIIGMLVGFVPLTEAASSHGTRSWGDNISETFSYTGGIMIGMVNADNQKITFERGLQRMVVDEGGNILSVSIYGTDKIKNKANLITFLSGMGVSSDDLKVSGGDDGAGGVVTSEAGWLSDAAEWLAKGINYSISIDLAAAGGPKVTLSLNGDPQKAYDTVDGEARLVTKWAYNEDGSLANVEMLEMEALSQEQYDELADKTGYEQQGKFYVKEVAVRTEYRAGKSVVAHEIDGMKGSVVTANIRQWTYAKNGGMLTMTDNKTMEMTSYSDGRALNTVTSKDVYVDGELIAAEGSIVREWNYHENGSLDTVGSMDGRGGWTTTAYDKGRSLITVEGRGGNGDSMRATYASILAGKYNAEANAAGVVSISVYVDQLSQALVANVAELTGSELNEVNAAIQAHSGGNGAGLALAISYNNTLTGNSNDGNTTYLSDVDITLCHYGQRVRTLTYDTADPNPLPAAQIAAPSAAAAAAAPASAQSVAPAAAVVSVSAQSVAVAADRATTILDPNATRTPKIIATIQSKAILVVDDSGAKRWYVNVKDEMGKIFKIEVHKSRVHVISHAVGKSLHFNGDYVGSADGSIFWDESLDPAVASKQ